MADATAAELMGGLAQELEHLAPNISIRVLPLTTRDPRNLLESGAVDLALGYFPAALADLTARAQVGEATAFEHHRLYDGEYVCVMRKAHPLATENISLENFCKARHLLVSFSGRPYGFIDEALTSIGKQRRVVMTVNQFFTAGRMVVNSDLLTVLPRHFVPTTGMSNELFLCDLPFKVPTLHVDALWHRRKHAQSDHRWLRDVLINIAHDVFKGHER
jgi:DNA-binding transcriptional LysR family regulator